MSGLSVRDPVTVRSRMSDGTHLVADVYRPAGPGHYPVLLMRQPYGRKIASTVVLAHPAWYAARGYVVMVQDVRGRGDSEGRFRLLEDDIADGAETLAAAAGLDGSDGRVATYGFSYQGATQYLALAGALASGGVRPSAMAIVMAPWFVRDEWAYEGGQAFRLGLNQLWALQMAAEDARLRGDGEGYHGLRTAATGLAGAARPADLPALDAHGPESHYRRWRADDADHWARVSPAAALAGRTLDVPVLHVGGWLDIMLEGTLAAHAAFRRHTDRAYLKMTPWPHLPWTRRVGALDCAGADDGIDGDIAGFLDHVLKGAEPPAARVSLYDLGRRAYAGFTDLPEPDEVTRLHLASGGRAGPSQVDGRLGEAPLTAGEDRLVHDPWRPAPAVGLHLGTPGGYADRSEVDGRTDVLTYTALPASEEMTLYGAGRLTLQVTADAPAFDVIAVLSVVAADGRAIAITSGVVRQMVPPAGPVEIALRPTLITLRPGERLRLSLQAAFWPALMVNPGTGEVPEAARLADCRVITLTVRHGPEAPSVLALRRLR